MSNIAFFLFLLVTATLILRPSELVPSLAGWPIYEALIVSACGLSLPQMQRRISIRALGRQPITLCVVGVLAAVMLSHFTHMYLYGTRTSGTLFLKTLIYYLLLISVVDSPRRLHRFLLAVATFSSVMISLCVVDYLGWFDLPFIKHISEQDGLSVTGAVQRVDRLVGTGIFSDPNDISLLIVATGVLCLYFLTDKSAGGLRLGWLFPLAVLGVALLFTRSRGGLLAAGGAGMILVLSRYGRKTAFAFGVLGLCLLPFVAGRQGDIDLSSGTGQDRLLLWRDGFAAIKSPNILFGIGQGMYGEMAGLVAHNSFVHAYVELGLFGGTLFFGCFFFPALALYRLSDPTVRILNPRLARMRPYVAALLAAWAAGLLSLSRCYVVPTYMIIGIAAAYLSFVSASLRPQRQLVYCDSKHFTQLAAGSAMLFGSIYVFVVAFAG